MPEKYDQQRGSDQAQRGGGVGTRFKLACETSLKFVCFQKAIFTAEDVAVQLVIWHTAA